MMEALWLRAASSRTLKKWLGPWLPETVAFPVSSELHVYLDPRDRTGPSYYLAHGGPAAFDHYEQSEKAEILTAFPPDGVFVDAGANIGLFSLWVAHRFPLAQVHAFEPHPLLSFCLTESVRVSELNVQVHAAALGSAPGRARLHHHKSSSGGHSLLESEIEAENRARTFEIPVETLDGLALPRIDFIKADVQGFEREVLLGGAESIRRSRPTFLLELENRSLLSGDSFFETFFRELGGYSFRVAGGGEFLEISRLGSEAQMRLDAGRLHTNYVFGPSR